jgi:flagellar motor switch protein FliM
MNEPGSPAAAPDTAEVSVLLAKGVRANYKSAEVRGHDFRQSGFLAPSELRRIRQRHEQFTRALAARLAMFLRLEFTLQVSKVQIVGYQKFIEGLPSPTHITLFKTEPLKGVGLLVIPPRLGLNFVDRLLGGPGQMPAESHELSEIEIALIDQVATLILSEWCAHWPEMRGLQSSLLGHENNSRYLQTATPDTAMLVLTIGASLGEQSESIQIVFPYATVEPLMRLLTPALPVSDATSARTAKPRWNPEFDEVKVPIVVEWQGLKMSAGEITRLKAGDLLALDPAIAANVQILLNHIPKFTGRPGTCVGKWAVQITGTSNNHLT